MFHAEELFRQINRLKKGKAFWTNSFFLSADLERIARREDAVFAYSDRAIAVLLNDNGVDRLTFYLAEPADAAELKRLLDGIGRGPVVLDCVGNREYVDSLTQALEASGFILHAHMSRWHSRSIRYFLEPSAEDGTFRFAVPDDIPEILAILYDVLDPLVGHLPSGEKLRDLISQQLVYCAVFKEKVIAVVCLEKMGDTGIYIYADAVSGAYQSSGIGIWLLQYALGWHRGCRRFTSWTDDRNRASNRMHKMLGMEYDGLKDAVLLYQPYN